jgi:DNA-binding protein H-NS
MASYKELLLQIRELRQQADEMKMRERNDAIRDIREKIAMFDLKEEELFSRTGRAPSKFAGRSVPAKYRDHEGHTWSGRGKQPLWLVKKLMSGASLDDFLIR